MPSIRRALISVTNKTGIVEFASSLAGAGVELVSTGGTARELRQGGLAVREVADLTGFPEMLDGRVKTLHPRIAGGILAIRSNSEHMDALQRHSIGAIDMVVVNLYDFGGAARREDASFEDLIENIDIGGPTLIRSAAKNFSDVVILTDPRDYGVVSAEISETGGVSLQTRWMLARKAFDLTAGYDGTIAATLAPLEPGRDPVQPLDDSPPPRLNVSLPMRQRLRYGENPHQEAALYSGGAGGIGNAKQLHGKALSYNNLVDLDASWQLAAEFEAPTVAIIKHTNPCGCAQADTLAEAYRRALACDPLSAFGSVVAVTRTVDVETASEMSKLFIEAIAAPGYDQGALEVLQKKRNLRLLQVQDAIRGYVFRSISGGCLVQSDDRTMTTEERLAVATERAPTDRETEDLLFAWRVVKHVKSNAILYARNGRTVGVGAGQMSRVDAARVGAIKAVLPLEGSVVASDAFFPFPDGVEEVAKHGATAVIQPGGSRRDPEVIAAADRLGLAMVLTGERHFRH